MIKWFEKSGILKKEWNSNIHFEDLRKRFTWSISLQRSAMTENRPTKVWVPKFAISVVRRTD
jgi:hypothetical protein